MLCLRLVCQALDELQPYTETWAGMELTPAIAYGFRLYRDGAVLNMHVDKKQTHIISMIYHIDSESEEPWPIYVSSSSMFSGVILILWQQPAIQGIDSLIY